MVVFNHIGLVVRDLDRSQRFYEALGFSPWYGDAIPDAGAAKLLGLTPPLGVRVVYLVLDGFVLELLHYGAPGVLDDTGDTGDTGGTAQARTFAQPGLSHVSVSVADIRATAEVVVAHGGTIVEESDLGVALVVRDPDGQLIELLTHDYPTRRTSVPRPSEGADA